MATYTRSAGTEMVSSRALLEAIDADDEEAVSELLQEKGDGGAGIAVNGELPLPGWRGCTLLHWAVQQAHLHVIGVLLHRGAAVDAVDASGDTVLHLAARCRRTAVVSLLSDMIPVIGPNARNHDGDTALHIAASSGALHVAKKLLCSGANPNLQNASGDSPLHVASRSGQTLLVKLLLSCDAVDVGLKNRDGDTALHLAVCSTKAHCAEALLRMRLPRVDARNKLRFTPLHSVCSCMSRKLDGPLCKRVVETLLQEGADASARCGEGNTPLHLAARAGNSAAISALFSSNISDGTGGQSEDQGNSPISAPAPTPANEGVRKDENYVEQRRAEYVTRIKQVLNDVAERELQEEISPSPNRREFYSADWLQLAPKSSSPEARVNAANKEGETPLHLAAMHGHRTAAEALLELGASVNRMSRSLDTALDYAFRSRHDSVAALLIRRGAEMTSKVKHALVEAAAGDAGRSRLVPRPRYWDLDDAFLLHTAAMAGRTKVLEALLDVGVRDVNCKNEWRQTPLHCAAIVGKTSVVMCLVCRQELRANAEDRSGKTALQYAVECKHVEVEKLLLERADVKESMDRMYRDRQVYVDAANAILVGAALIGGVTFAGWLQPPLGYSFHGFAATEVAGVRVFWAFNSLSFCFSMCTVLACAGAVLPRPDVYIASIVQEVRRALALAAFLLVVCIQCVLAAFAAAGFAVLPSSVQRASPWIMGGTVALGAAFALALMSWFLNKLWALLPRWCTSPWRGLLLNYRWRRNAKLPLDAVLRCHNPQLNYTFSTTSHSSSASTYP